MPETHLSEILHLSRQQAAGDLSPWFAQKLAAQIENGSFISPAQLDEVLKRLTASLADYRQHAGLDTVVLGMSGGVDSALTAALFKKAGWRVVGYTLPIRQAPEETERGRQACEALGIVHHHLDLTAEYDALVTLLSQLDPPLADADDAGARTRRGNLRARLRMATLYDQANRFGGLVASTDNFSELGAGFWTLHGDVGDLAPLQGLIKSWEVPWLARAAGVPEKTWRAKPTDGLGIGEGDEAQIGATYLQWDILVFAVHDALEREAGLAPADLASALAMDADPAAQKVLARVLRRLQRTWFKRVNPIQFDHPLHDRLARLDKIDERLFRPADQRRKTTRLEIPDDLRTAAEDLCRCLTKRDMRLVTAESCTGGLLAASLSAVPHSTANLEGSFVTYRPSMKVEALGVPEELIDARTVYDPKVACRMAEGALQAASGADLALAITGVAGSKPDQGKPSGYMCIAACLRGHSATVQEFVFEGDPQAILSQTIAAALSMGVVELQNAAEPQELA